MTADSLRETFGNNAVDFLFARIAAGGAPEIDPALFASALVDGGIAVDAIAFLNAAAAAGILQAVDLLRCPVPACPGYLSREEIAAGRCPTCQTDLREYGEEPIAIVRYRTGSLPTRDIPWFIAIHGMNTLGDWQQEFSWQVANKLKYHAPVLIYKYGLIRASVLVRWRHRAIARKLGYRIRGAVAHARMNQIAEPPDILIHSFGSQLFRLVLEMKEFGDLNFGRVIAAGSVIRPDFDWGRLIEAGCVEAVLCHCAGKDLAVPAAQFFIPGCGPGGRHGFMDPAVSNVMSEGFGHSTVLAPTNLSTNLATGGIWDRFLTAPSGHLDASSTFKPEQRKAQPRLVRGSLRTLGVGILLTTASVLTFAGAWVVVWLAAKALSLLH
jgi:hypothetical protein